MRKILVALGILIAVLVIGFAILLATINPNQFRGTIQADLQRQLHRPVSLGNMSLNWFPLAIRVDDVQVGENPLFQTGRPFAQLKEVRVRAELLPLLRKEVHINSLDVTQPSVELVRNAAGQWNFDDLTSEPSGNASPITIGAVQVTDGALGVSDLGNPSSRTVYNHIDLTLNDFAPGKTFRVRAAVQAPGAARDSIVLEGTGQHSNAAQTPFDGHLTLTQVPLAALGKFTGTALPVDGSLSGAADIHSANSVANLRGKLDLAQASVHGSKLGVPFSADYDVSDDTRSGIIRAQNMKLTAGKVVVNASAEMNSKLKTISASARTANASLAELLALARVFGAGEMTGSGVVSLDVSAVGPLNGVLNYTGSASIPEAQISTGSSGGPLKVQNANLRFNRDTAAIEVGSLASEGLVLSNVRSNCIMNRGVVTMSPVSAQIFGGTAAGSITVDTNPKPPALALNLKLAGVDANQLLSATSSVKNTLYGSLASSGDLKLRLATAEALARSMNGVVSLNLTKGHIAGVNIMNELATIGKFVGYSVSTQNMTQIVKLAGDLRITNGVADTNNLELQMEGGSLAATGSMNLADQTLNLKTTAVIDHATSQKVGGKSIGGFMQTALANSKGELVIPAIVTGTFAHPHFAPDVQQMAQMRLKNLLPTANSPGKALLNILPGQSQQGGQQQGGQQQQLPGAIGNALDSILKRKK